MEEGPVVKHLNKNGSEILTKTKTEEREDACSFLCLRPI